MVITGKRYSDSDIWSKTPNKDTNTKDMIFIILYKEAMKKTKINP